MSAKAIHPSGRTAEVVPLRGGLIRLILKKGGVQVDVSEFEGKFLEYHLYRWIEEGKYLISKRCSGRSGQ